MVAGGTQFTSRFSVLSNLTDGQPYDLTLYAVDWADDGRSELIQITNPATGSMLSVKCCRISRQARTCNIWSPAAC